MHRFMAPLLLVGSFFIHQQALALVSVAAQYSRHTVKTSNAADMDLKTSGNAVAGELHVDPIPLIPISFGLSLGYLELKAADFGDFKKVSLMEGSFEMMAWLPMIPYVIPHIRLSIPVYGPLIGVPNVSSITAKEIKTELSGYAFHGGLSFSILPLTSLFVEAGLSNKEAKDLFGKSREFNATIYTVGLEVGL